MKALYYIGNLSRILSGIMLLYCFMLGGCVEELDLENLNIAPEQGLLVVEATLTDRIEIQEVILSRSEVRLDLETDTVYNPFLPFGLGARDSVVYEGNASIRLIGSNGSRFAFTEGETGFYESEEAFGLEEGVNYQLDISTSDGREYLSGDLQITGVARLESVYAERITNAFGVEGIQIYADASPVRGDASNLRFSYEETYKIIAPNWNELDFKLTNYDPCALPVPTYNLEIVPREVQNRVCYNTVPSSRIIQNATASASSSTLRRFPVRFISRDDFILTHRYSILLRQQVQSPDAYAFYQTLNNFSDAQSVFSQVQPGPLTANVSRKDGAQENVLGYVEAVSVDEQRIYFNYEDFFPGEPLPPYPFTCIDHSSPESHVSYCFTGMNSNTCPQSIIERVNLGLSTYTGENIDNIGTCPGPYTYVNRICGDCTLLGENTVPDFWEE